MAGPSRCLLVLALALTPLLACRPGRDCGRVKDEFCLPDGQRMDCGHVGTTRQECESSGCCWQPENNNPWCFYRTSYYVVSDVKHTTLGYQLTITNGNTSLASPFGSNMSPLTVDIAMETDDRLHVKIFPPNATRWEIPASISPIPSPPSSPPSDPQYSVVVPSVGEPFYFAVVRNSNKETVFNTSIDSTLQFNEQYLQLGTALPTGHNVYGLGEHEAPLRLPDRTYTLWNYDTATPAFLNVYGSHPFYLELRPDGNAHGVFLRNSNGMDIVLGQNSLVYKVIGGIFDFYFFLGPGPESVVQQYQEVIGRPHLPPYWGLGFHQCRYGYPNVSALIDVVDSYASNKIPLDTMWTDIDYMDGYRDFTLDPVNFPEDKMDAFVESLHKNGQHYVVIIDPGIKTDRGYKPYDDGVSEGIFIKDQSGNVFTGKVWPGITAFPDFLHPKAQQYWTDQISTFRSTLLPVDGLWIDMNEISNFCNGECTSVSENGAGKSGVRKFGFNPVNPPYAINNQGSKQPLNIKTLDMNAVHYNGVLEYFVHNLFGLTEAIATNNALMTSTGQRSFVISRSTFPSSGSHTGHWTGDNHANANDMYVSIPGMLNFQMFGIPLVGSDICGFIGNSNEQLCSRWIEVGAFYPFSRDHNTKGAAPQELYVWPSVAAIARKVLGIRYSLLPYYYTLFYKASRPIAMGNPAATVTRPLFFEFPKDSMTYAIDRQFMVGSSLLISPVLDTTSTSVTAYFPPARWYDWYTHQVVSAEGGELQTLSTPIDHIQVHVRSGAIIPMQEPALTTTASRANNFSLLIALDDGGSATGDLFLDDGVSIDVTKYTFVTFTLAGNKLSSTVSGSGYGAMSPPLSNVTVLGVASSPQSVTLNGNSVPFSFDAGVLAVFGLMQSLASEFSLAWQ